MKYQIKNIKHDEIEQLFQFIKKAYPGSWRYKLDSFWDWKFRRNPYVLKDNLFSVIVATNMDSQILGQTCTLKTCFHIMGEVVSGGWSIDTIVQPEFRGYGVGKALQLANRDQNDAFLSLSMSDVNRHIKAKQGSFELKSLRLFQRRTYFSPNFARQYLLYRTRHRNGLNRLIWWASKFLGVHFLFEFLYFFPRQSRNMRTLLNFSIPNNYSLKEEFCFPEEIGDFFSTVKQGDYIYTQRTRDYMDWRYFHHPQFKYRLFVLRKSGVLKGYVILRNSIDGELSIGHITELVFDSSDKACGELLLGHSISVLQKKFASVEISDSDNSLDDLLAKYGFVHYKNYYPMIHIKDKLLAEKISEKECRCFFSKGDHDLDQFNYIGG